MNIAILGASIPWLATVGAILFFVVCVFLILIVLLQKGRGGGLSAAFGGAGGQSAFGSKTGDVFTWVTVAIVVLFFLLAILLTKYYKPVSTDLPPSLGSDPTTAPIDTPTAEPKTADEPAGDKTDDVKDQTGAPAEEKTDAAGDESAEEEPAVDAAASTTEPTATTETEPK